MTQPAARFSITVDGTEVASFTEFSGIVPGRTPPPRPGQPPAAPPGTATLSHGTGAFKPLWDWYQAVRAGEPGSRRTCMLTSYSSAGAPVDRYQLDNAWPTRVDLTGPAGNPAPTVQTSTLSFDSYTHLSA